jgi:serine/threonine-protein kinase RsbW
VTNAPKTVHRQSCSNAVTVSKVMRVPHRVAAVPEARRQVRGELAEAEVPSPVLDDAEMVVSELLGNAARHAREIPGGVLLLAWCLSAERLIVRVTDGGSSSPVRYRPAGPLADSGRGLRIVEKLAEEWGVRDHDGGLRTVWAALSLSCPPCSGGLRLFP